MEREVKIVLNPCGHTFCESCSEKINTCPTCRSNVVSRIKFYFEQSNTSKLSEKDLNSLTKTHKQLEIFNDLIIAKENDFETKYKHKSLEIENKAEKIIKETNDKKENLIKYLNELKYNSNDAINKFKEKKLEIENQLNEIQTQITNQNIKSQQLMNTIESLNLNQIIDDISQINSEYDLKKIEIKNQVTASMCELFPQIEANDLFVKFVMKNLINQLISQ